MKQKLLNLFLILFVSSFSFAQVANQPSNLMVCDDDNDGFFLFFDLTFADAEVLGGQNPADFIVTYHETQSDAENGVNALQSPYGNVVPSLQTIYIRLEEISSGNFDTTTLDLIVNFSPIPTQPSSLDLCDDINDGFAEFDLTVKNAEIIGANTNVSVTYYETISDAENQTNPISNPTSYTNLTNPQTLFLRLTDLTNGCSYFYTSGNLTIRVLPSPDLLENPDDIEICDDGSGFSIFDLTTNESSLDPSGEGFLMNYYVSLVDADSRTNAISNPENYVNTSNPQEIYVRVENDVTECYTLTSFNILVNPLPYFSISDIAYCQGESVVIDTGLEEINYSFEWTYEGSVVAGETQPTLAVNQPGDYTVYVTDLVSACVSLSTITVEEVDCTDSDSDGVIDIYEDINGNGNLDDDDTDNDGVPNYLDSDDDGDNVPTEVEVGGVSGRNSSTVSHQFIDTDNDSIENYLDNDDDGDGVLTIDEDYNNNGDPTDDDTNSNMISDYLEAAVALNVNNFNVEAFKIYPNPAKATLYIQMDNIYSNVEVLIYDVQGKQIGLSKTLSSNITELDVSNFESGIYFVKLSNNKVSVTEKLVIQ